MRIRQSKLIRKPEDDALRLLYEQTVSELPWIMQSNLFTPDEQNAHTLFECTLMQYLLTSILTNNLKNLQEILEMAKANNYNVLSALLEQFCSQLQEILKTRNKYGVKVPKDKKKELYDYYYGNFIAFIVLLFKQVSTEFQKDLRNMAKKLIMERRLIPKMQIPINVDYDHLKQVFT